VFDVFLSAAAQADIRHIVDWWSANRSKDEAERWYVAAIEKIYSLERLPYRCPVARESDRIGVEIRHLLFGVAAKHTHRVLYQIEETTVTVLRILSTSQDSSNLTS
jgi:plasmid stabilization system protein ParE